MFSSDELVSRPSRQKQWNRRPQRSCDVCRQRKTRCDAGLDMAGTQCSTCLAFGVPCTYITPTRRRGPKSRLEEELRQKIADLEAELRSLSVCSRCAQPLRSEPEQLSPPSDTPKSASATFTEADSPPPDEDIAAELVARFDQISIAGTKGKFFGSASNFSLVAGAIVEKEKYTGGPQALEPHLRRRIYWELLPWEKELHDQRPHYVYPARDLIASLLELYFTNVHPILPVVHRPSFERYVAEGLHLKDTRFGATLLAVLAIGSRYSDDPRVLIDGETSLSSGWKFVAQVPTVRKYLEGTIHEAQFYCLMALYSIGITAHHVTWLYLGLGIRYLQHRDEHRRKLESHEFEDELWNRVFWSMFALDRIMCVQLGRPAAIHLEDYDVAPLIEVDDEYWEHGFTQPPGKPSFLSYFACLLRLCEIMGDALRRLYPSKKLKNPVSEQSVVVELDSAMNDFFNSIPPHLRRDPDPDGQGVFFNQSVILYTMYYSTQITIHKPYIHNQAMASRSICTAAARSVLHVAATWMNTAHCMPFVLLQSSAAFSAVILILNIFASKRAGLPVDSDKDLRHVGTALKILKCCEGRYQAAGRFWELLQALLSLDSPPSPAENFVPGSSVTTNGPLSGGSFEYGMSIEQLLATTGIDSSAAILQWDSSSGVADGVLDDEIMSVWPWMANVIGMPVSTS
ncbi:fungal-specific transcription factor domain-containing protein [Mycena maculata]|uniref:Fungal-specific transcription factor domain-containing protein n=1 Tax=Mycena maculata TaxID=230809 RepID=A0AAD7NVI7_9AGAR|nr:fungal-specific transcription factor domain-containing protein [Mycena maculata]